MTAPDRVIWKYVLPILLPDDTGTTTFLHIPGSARLLAVQAQHDDISLWFEIPDPAAPPVRREFRVFGTGQEPVPDRYDYRGTVQFGHGLLVLHVYEADR